MKKRKILRVTQNTFWNTKIKRQPLGMCWHYLWYIILSYAKILISIICSFIMIVMQCYHNSYHQMKHLINMEYCTSFRAALWRGTGLINMRLKLIRVSRLVIRVPQFILITTKQVSNLYILWPHHLQEFHRGAIVCVLTVYSHMWRETSITWNSTMVH